MPTMEAPPRLQVRLHQGAFTNEPFVDFTKEDNVRKMRSAIEKVRGQLGRKYDLIIGGKRIKTSDKIRSPKPPKRSRPPTEGRKRALRTSRKSRSQRLYPLEPHHRRRACFAPISRR